MANFILVLSLALLFSSLVVSHPHKHGLAKEKEGLLKIKMTKAVPLSQVRNPSWIGKEQGMIVFKEQHYGLSTPLVLMAVYTNNPSSITPSGSIRFTGISISSDTLLSLHFKTARNVSFTDAILRFQLETLQKKSPVQNVYVDTMASLCPIQGSELLHKMHCTRPSSSSIFSSTADMLIIDGVPVPDFDDFVIGGSSSIGTLHLWMEDESGNLLMDGRFFMKQEEEDDE